MSIVRSYVQMTCESDTPNIYIQVCPVRIRYTCSKVHPVCIRCYLMVIECSTTIREHHLCSKVRPVCIRCTCQSRYLSATNESCTNGMFVVSKIACLLACFACSVVFFFKFLFIFVIVAIQIHLFKFYRIIFSKKQRIYIGYNICIISSNSCIANIC